MEMAVRVPDFFRAEAIPFVAFAEVAVLPAHVGAACLGYHRREDRKLWAASLSQRNKGDPHSFSPPPKIEKPAGRATRLYALALRARDEGQTKYAEQLEKMAARAADEADRYNRQNSGGYK